ncbi:MAG: hypothetical protein COV07_03835 [Candidatus Vogelbacteria bacterium CG10_big_fil_rev_8_21_14_0_10_45_14]|uniref:DUF3105 domain-containing protein n=1 Tax=Candidatus Vogelbacteria bacterium CG10_big_fil_rev_8_21_14_0_10_45_14 TaxID=1975042 RepID=A0A2H0RJA9_9BACT|nr:MAG: hypothetical protein COV07_03835 [Candidatus Vogelbacteria bacterium CG10_big_fil_rev_8_21_14_0_10_45_14]
MKSTIAVIAISVVLLFMGLWYTSTPKENKVLAGESVPIQGQQHIKVSASHPPYNSNPPSSGWHYANPAKWGVHEEELPDEQVIHNLEHGGIWITYKDLSADELESLTKLARLPKVIMTPRATNDASIALVSWGQVQKLGSFDEDAILNFITTNRNQSPEPYAN